MHLHVGMAELRKVGVLLLARSRKRISLVARKHFPSEEEMSRKRAPLEVV